MAKVINAVENATPEAVAKMVSIKHTRVMKNANGNDVSFRFMKNKKMLTKLYQMQKNKKQV